MNENNIVYIKENIVNIIVGFLSTTIIGVLTVYFVVVTWNVLEIRHFKDIFSLLVVGQLLLGIVGFISCTGALSYFIQLVRRPYIRLSLNGIDGNAIKKSLQWNDISEIHVVEMPKWYFRLLQGLVGAAARPGRLSASYRLANDFGNENIQKELAKTCIIDKTGNKYTIALENGYTIKDKIMSYMHNNNITL